MSRRLRLHKLIPAGVQWAIARTPSHFNSAYQPPGGWGGCPGLASIGAGTVNPTRPELMPARGGFRSRGCGSARPRPPAGGGLILRW